MPILDPETHSLEAPGAAPAPRSRAFRLLRGPAVILGGLALLTAGALGGMAWLRSRPVRILLLPPALEEGCGLTPGQADGLATILEDQFSLVARATVFNADSEPDRAEWRPGQEGLVLRIRPRRIGKDLRLDLDLAKVSTLRAGGGFRRVAGTPLDPARAIDGLCRVVNPWSSADREGRLVPLDPEAFWNLLEAASRFNEGRFDDQAEALLDAVRQRAPGCATPDVIHGEALAYQSMEQAAADPALIRRAYGHLESALRKAPFHHRALYYLVQLKLESSEVREAVGLALQGHKAFPKSRGALLSLDYAGRYGGLLPLSVKATEVLDEFMLVRRPSIPVQTAYLYSGQWDRFERSLTVNANPVSGAFLMFERGYLAMLRGDRALALRHFKDGAAAAEWQGYKRLSSVFVRLLTQDAAGARDQLKELEQTMFRARIPDGEMALNLAEAHALLGETETALDMATRAFTLGLGCASWFEQDPLLQSLSSLPRWKALLTHMKERQALVERMYPPDTWGF